MRSIIKAQAKDLEDILLLLEEGRQIMRQSGNTAQWSDGYPKKEMILRDILLQGAYLVTDPEGTIEAYFAFLEGPDSTYGYIYEGQWTDTATPYHVLHRLAKRRGAKEVFPTVMEFMRARAKSIRVDTHEKNPIMRRLMDKYGFTYCGKIICSDGTERLAYQKVF